MSYNFEIAKEVLSDQDKARFLCLYLNCQPSAIDWEKATKDFGCASVDSMRVMTRAALKKIEKAGGKEGVEASPAKATGRKRKAGAGNGEVESPKKKGDSRKTQKSAAPAENEDAGGEDEIKAEGTDQD